MEAKSVTAQVGNQNITIETGKMAKQADGSVVLRAGDSVVLVTAVSAKDRKEGLDFFPLTVDYQERLSAAGRIPGSFFRREGRLTERETLISRLIDRSCRPLFPEGYQNETQIIATVFSADNQYDTDVLALTGASFALAMSDVPFPFAFAGVRVGRVGGKFIANPSELEREQGDVDVIMAASRDAIFMVEGGAKEIDENTMVEALLFGQRAIEQLLDRQEELRRALGKPKRSFEKAPFTQGIPERVREAVHERVRQAYARDVKHERYGDLSQIKKDVVAQLCGEGAEFCGKEREVKQALEDLKYEYMRRMITHEGRRIGVIRTGTAEPRAPLVRSRMAMRTTPPAGRPITNQRGSPPARDAASAAAATIRSAPSPARWGYSRVRTDPRSSPAAKRRAWSPPRWGPATTSSGWRASRGSPSASSCCTTTSRPTPWAK